MSSARDVVDRVGGRFPLPDDPFNRLARRRDRKRRNQRIGAGALALLIVLVAAGAFVRATTVDGVPADAPVPTITETPSGTFRVREDPNDVSAGWDIRRVLTRTTPTDVVLRIGMWDPLDVSVGQIVVSVDTRGGPGTDRFVTVGRDRVHGYQCRVWRGLNGDFDGVVGRRDARRTERSISCNLPLSWFDIRKTVNFRLFSNGIGDRAPNQGNYVGL